MMLGLTLATASFAGGKTSVKISPSAVPAGGYTFTDADPLTVCVTNLSSRAVYVEMDVTGPGAPLHTNYIFSLAGYETHLFDQVFPTGAADSSDVRIASDGSACGTVTGTLLPGT